MSDFEDFMDDDESDDGGAVGYLEQTGIVGVKAKPVSLSNDAAEEAVIGAMLCDPAFAMPIVSDLLTARDFTRPRHAVTFRMIETLWNMGAAIDPVMLLTHIENDRLALAVFGSRGEASVYLGYMIDMVPHALNVKYHAGLLTAATTRRDIVTTAEGLLASATDGTLDVSAVVQETMAALVALAAVDGDARGFQKLDPGATLFEIEQRAQKPKSVVRTGYRCIDDEFYGYRAGELHIIGGSAKSGKTAFALNIALNIADQGHGVGIVACEMTRSALTERLLNNAANVQVGATARGRFDKEETERLVVAAGYLKSLPIEVDDGAMPDIDDVAMRVMDLKTRKPETKVVIVDFLQLLTARLRGANEAALLKYISYRLVGIAKRTDTVLIAPTQLNHKQIDGESREPELRDLQGSSGMAQAATGVLLVWREATPPGPFSAAERFVVKCVASRRTPMFRSVLEWHGRYMRVSEPQRAAVASNPFGGHA